MSKNPNKLSACLSVVHNAQTHTTKYPSTAEPTDAVTREMRAGCLFVTRITNQLTGTVEISAQQAAAAVIGMPSAFSTSAFTYVFPYAAMQHVEACRPKSLAPSSSPAADEPSSDSESDTSSVRSNEGAEGDGEGSTAGDQDVYAAMSTETSNTGTASTYNVGGLPVTVPQHDHYRYRGPAFKYYCLYEWAALVQVVKKRAAKAGADVEEGAEEGADVAAEGVGRGRTPSAQFDFDPDHPLAATHTQQLRSKQFTPVLAGKSCPRYPGGRPAAPSRAWELKARAFSEYILVLFQPWDLTTKLPGEISWDAFSAYMGTLQDGPVAYVDRSKARIIHNIARGLTCSSRDNYIATRYRARAADLLLKKTWGKEGDDVYGLQRVHKEAASAIERLQAAADGGTQHKNYQAFDAYIQRALLSAAAAFGPTPPGNQEYPVGHSVVQADADGVHEMVGKIYACNPAVTGLLPPEPASVTPSGSRSGAGDIPLQPPAPIAGGVQANLKQREGIAIVVDYINQLQAHRASPDTVPPPPQLNLFVTGAPGVGKSFFVRELNTAVKGRGSRLVCAAFTGCAATQLPHPQTLHSVLHFGGGRNSKKKGATESSDMNRPLHALKPADLQALREYLKDVDVFLIDEVWHLFSSVYLPLALPLCVSDCGDASTSADLHFACHVTLSNVCVCRSA